MRALVVLCLFVALVAALVLLTVGGGWSRLMGGEEKPPGSGDTAVLQSPAIKSSTAIPRANTAIATRLQAAPPNDEGVADVPTACLQVVDHASKNPIAAAAVRRVQGGASIAFTDEHGLASVPLKQPEQLAAVVDGYLLRLVPTQLGSTEAKPQQVLLVRDVWSFCRRFHFVDPDGKAVAEAFVRFRPHATTRVPSPMPQSEVLLQRAWAEHTMLAGRPAFEDVPVQLGSFAEGRVHRLADGAEVRFVAAGEFTVEVATPEGLVARREVRIEGAAGSTGEPVRINLVRGEFVSGTVMRLDTSAPLAGAELTVQEGEPLGLVATSAGDGTFAIGPLLGGSVTLNVRHGDCVPQAFGPLVAPAIDVRILLQPFPSGSLRGCVRSRPGLQPIAGAMVVWSPSGGTPVTAKTGPDGTFLLRATGTTAARLMVQAPLHQLYAELVEPDAAFADYDVWPATRGVRLEKRLSAVLQGIVVDAEGRPVPGVAVRWNAQPSGLDADVPFRRTLEGGMLELPPVATTGVDGAFDLETNYFGAGRLTVGAGPGGAGIDAEAIAGKATTGLRLQR